MFEVVGVAIDECSARGEVQIFLNFSLHCFGSFAILRALSGDGRSGAKEYEEELDSLLSGDML